MQEKNSNREMNEPAALRRNPDKDQRDRRPRVDVQIGRPGGMKTTATAMIATGAEASFVRGETAKRLGLGRPRGLKWTILGDDSTKQIDVAEAAVGLNDGTVIAERMELGVVEELPEDFDLVIGRDGLANATFHYDGTSGKATLKAGD